MAKGVRDDSVPDPVDVATSLVVTAQRRNSYWTLPDREGEKALQTNVVRQSCCKGTQYCSAHYASVLAPLDAAAKPE